jgi:hypothetical protein
MTPILRLAAVAAVFALSGLAAAPTLARTNHALIAAATEYPNLPRGQWLNGPVNDALLVRDFLLGNAPVPFAAANIEVLATAPGFANPTRQAVLDALQRLATRVAPGDFVYLQLSGHGSSQPTDDPGEADGRDELYLPSDVRLPTAGEQTLPNAITDNEIGAALDRIRAAGAFVWAIFDFCQSGTATRRAPTDGDGFIDRGLDPAALGLPPAAPASVGKAKRERIAPVDSHELAAPATGAQMGGLVAFFAAQSSESTQERIFFEPQSNGSVTEVTYGIFTHTLFTALARNPNLTYRQLGQSVLQQYSGDNRTKPTPMFEGDLDAPVFDSDEQAPRRQWVVTVAEDGTISIPAGQLHGLTTGARLDVLPAPGADTTLGILEVENAGPLRSTLRPAADARGDTIARAAIPKGGFVRLAALNFDFELRVARPAEGSADARYLAVLNAALDRVAGDSNRPLNLKLVDAGAPADLRLALGTEKDIAPVGGVSATAASPPQLWLLEADAAVSATATPAKIVLPAALSATPDLRLIERLAGNLVTIYRAMGLARLGATNSYRPTDISVDFYLQQSGSAAIAPMQMEATPVLAPGDQIHLGFTNTSGRAADLNILYVDADYGITLLCRTRVESKGRIFQPLKVVGDSRGAVERMIAVVTEAERFGQQEDLGFLVQRGVKKGGGGSGAGLSALLARLGNGGSSGKTGSSASSSSMAAPEPRGAVSVYPLEVLAGRAAETEIHDPRALAEAPPLREACDTTAANAG